MNHARINSAHARGFSLVAAIFVLVVLAALGVFIVTIGAVQRATVTAALQGARTLQAAQAGAEWAAFGAINTPGATCTGAPQNFNLAAAGLNGFAVSVTCAAATFTEQGTSYQVFTINSTATFGTFGTPDFTQRSISTTITNAL